MEAFCEARSMLGQTHLLQDPPTPGGHRHVLLLSFHLSLLSTHFPSLRLPPGGPKKLLKHPPGGPKKLLRGFYKPQEMSYKPYLGPNSSSVLQNLAALAEHIAVFLRSTRLGVSQASGGASQAKPGVRFSSWSAQKPRIKKPNVGLNKLLTNSALCSIS